MLKKIFLIFLLTTDLLFAEGFIKKFELSGGTDFPLSLGAKSYVEIPYGINFSFGIGYLPKLYVETINDIVVSFDGYDENTADLIENSISDSLILSCAVGYKPFKNYGFYFDFGYFIAMLGGNVSSSELIAIVTGIDFSDYVNNDREIPASSTLHNLFFHLGYKFYPYKKMVIDTGLGLFKTIASKTELEFERSFTYGQQQEQMEKDVDKYMNKIYTENLISPIIFLNIGYFF